MKSSIKIKVSLHGETKIHNMGAKPKEVRADSSAVLTIFETVMKNEINGQRMCIPCVLEIFTKPFSCQVLSSLLDDQILINQQLKEDVRVRHFHRLNIMVKIQQPKCLNYDIPQVSHLINVHSVNMELTFNGQEELEYDL